MYKQIMVLTLMLLGLYAGSAMAQQPLNLQLPGSEPRLFVAALDTPSAPDEGKKTQMTKKEKEPYEERWFTLNTTHKYLGIGSLLAATISVLSPKSEDGIHHEAGQASAALGAAAVVTGLIAHYDDLSIDGGFDNPDNMHAALGTLGAIGFIMAADTGPDVPHATYGVVGGISMAVGIKYTW